MHDAIDRRRHTSKIHTYRERASPMSAASEEMDVGFGCGSGTGGIQHGVAGIVEGVLR